jgi:hypothetical protein
MIHMRTPISGEDRFRPAEGTFAGRDHDRPHGTVRNDSTMRVIIDYCEPVEIPCP